MDTSTASWLTNITSAFYTQVSTSFDATRQAPWHGWERVVDVTGACEARSARLLDVACGNLRFERYLFGLCDICEAWCVDVCDELVAPHVNDDARIRYVHSDVARELLDTSLLALPAEACDFNLAVCFGFMHHLPLVSQRVALLRTLLRATQPGGHVAVSFWQFMRDERIRAKARSFEGADEGDYLLGWQQRSDVARYCHHFCEDEIDELVKAVGDLCGEEVRYSADGRGNDLNRYVILKRA